MEKIINYMDLTFSKRLTQRFMRECGSNFDNFSQKLISVTYNSNTTKQNAKKNWSNTHKFINSSQNTYTIYNAEFGSKTKPAIGFCVLHAGNFNPNENRHEYLIFIQNAYFTFDPPDLQTSNITAIISHHVIQRIFQRHSEFKIDNFQKSFLIIKNEFKYINLVSLITSYFFLYISDFKKDYFKYKKYISCEIPCKGGILLGKFEDKSLNFRTFLDDNKLTDNQKKLKKDFIKLLDLYFDCSLPYIFEYAGANKDNVSFDLFHIMLGFIFKEISPVLKKLFLSFNQTKISKENKNKIIKNIENYILEFPSFILSDFEHLKPNINEFKNYVKGGRILEWGRKMKIKIHQENIKNKS